MKKFKKNEKGFTLIELLAVIVILAILVAVAIPATMRYLATARRGTFVSNVSEAVSAVRNDYISSGGTGTVYYTKSQINNLLEKKLVSSPYNADYTETSYVKVSIDPTSGMATYSVCFADNNKNGLSFNSSSVVAEANILEKNVVLNTVECAAISLGTGEKYAHTYANGGTTEFTTTAPTTK